MLLSPSIKPAIVVQKFCPFNDSSVATTTCEAALEFFLGIVVDNIQPALDQPFIFTEAQKCLHSDFRNFGALVYLKFASFEHRVVRTHVCKSCQSKITRNNYRNFNRTSDMSLLPLTHVLWTNYDEVEDVVSVDLLHDRGFLIISTSLCDYPYNDSVIAKRRTESNNMYLVRKISSAPSMSTLLSIDMSDFLWVEALKGKMKTIEDDVRVNLFSMSTNSGIIGFMKCLLKEPGCENIRCIYIPGSIMLNTDNFLTNSDVLKKDLVFNVYKNEVWGSYVNMTIDNLEIPRISEHVYANIQTVGDLTSLYWEESSCKLHERQNYNIHFSSLNFRDIMIATGKLPKTACAKHIQRHECILGGEFSGTFQNKRVCG
ncbi:unnamed protein product, partial [Allacma fusca]